MAVLLSLVEHLLNVKDVEVVNCDMSELKIKNINNIGCRSQNNKHLSDLWSNLPGIRLFLREAQTMESQRLEWNSSHAQISRSTHYLSQTQCNHRSCAVGISQVTFYL